MTGRHIIEAHQALTEMPRHVEYGWLKLRLPVNCQTIRKQPYALAIEQQAFDSRSRLTSPESTKAKDAEHRSFTSQHSLFDAHKLRQAITHQTITKVLITTLT